MLFHLTEREKTVLAVVALLLALGVLGRLLLQ